MHDTHQLLARCGSILAVPQDHAYGRRRRGDWHRIDPQPLARPAEARRDGWAFLAAVVAIIFAPGAGSSDPDPTTPPHSASTAAFR